MSFKDSLNYFFFSFLHLYSFQCYKCSCEHISEHFNFSPGRPHNLQILLFRINNKIYIFLLRFICVYKKSFKGMFQTGFWVQNHLLYMCSWVVNSQRLFLVKKLMWNVLYIKLSGILKLRLFVLGQTIDYTIPILWIKIIIAFKKKYV